MDIDNYEAQLTFGGSKNFPTGGDPATALEEAKAWVEREARAHFKAEEPEAEEGEEEEGEEREALPEERQQVGSIFATGPEGSANEPTTTLFVGSSRPFEWD